jgi:hypothetical protein
LADCACDEAGRQTVRNNRTVQKQRVMVTTPP